SGRRIRVEGELTLRTAPELCRAVREHIVDHGGSLDLDLARVTTCDVIGLAALLQSARAAEQRDIACLTRVGAAPRRTPADARLLDEIATETPSVAEVAWPLTSDEGRACDVDDPAVVLA